MSAAGNPNASARRSENIFHLRQAFKLSLSLVLFYWLALWTNWDLPQYGALAIVIVSLGTTGATIETGIMRVVGTTVGVAVGFLILGLFNGDRWATMVAFSAYITAMGYFMQTSRYQYAWYAAAFIPLVVWASNYPHFESAFYFGTFRWLETTVGILIYTMVDLVFWPRHAGDQLHPLGRDLWAQVQEQFGNSRRQLKREKPREGASGLRPKLAGTLSRTLSTLQDSYFDTPDISEQKHVWEVWRLNASGLVDALEIWRESIDDCRELELERLLPRLGHALDTLDNRLKRIGDLWESTRAPDDHPKHDDGLLLQKLALDLNRAACADLTHFERAAIMSFVRQLQILDRTSREVLESMRALTGIEQRWKLRVSSPVRDYFEPSKWDPIRLIRAFFPTATFIVGFLFWIFIDPPAGPKMAMVAAIFALVILRIPMSPLPLWLCMVFSTLFAVAPIYWLVMPSLSTGFGLLSLIFVYSFFFGYLGGRSPALKSGPIIQFVMTVGISNQQSYSFQGLVTGTLMTLLAGALMTVVYYFFGHMRPEQDLMHSLRRFFRGCVLVTRGFSWVGPTQGAKERRLRKRYLASMVLPAPGAIQKATQHLDYSMCPENSPEKVERLHDSIQSTVYRLQSLELARERMARQWPEFPESLVRLGNQVSETAQQMFEQWSRHAPGDAITAQPTALQQLSRNVQQQLDALDGQDREQIGDGGLADIYNVLGSARGLIAAMANTQRAINQINWRGWAATRF